MGMEDEDKKDLDQKEEEKDWKDTKTVPYKRFEEVVRKNQEYQGKIDELGAKFEKFINSGTKGAQDGKTLGEWDKRIKNASSWDEVFGELPKTVVKSFLNDPELRKEFVSEFKSELKKEESQAEEKVNQQVQALYDRDVITTKDEERAVINYAIKKSEELEEVIPLRVAVHMMKADGTWDKTLKGREDASKKVNKGTEAGGDEKSKAKLNYGTWKRKSPEELVADQKAKWDAQKKS